MADNTSRSNYPSCSGTIRTKTFMFECVKCFVRDTERNIIDHITKDHVTSGRAPWTCSHCGFQALTMARLREDLEHRQAHRNNIGGRFYGVKSKNPYTIKIGFDYIPVTDDDGASDPHYRKRRSSAPMFNAKRPRLKDRENWSENERRSYCYGMIYSSQRDDRHMNYGYRSRLQIPGKEPREGFDDMAHVPRLRNRYAGDQVKRFMQDLAAPEDGFDAEIIQDAISKAKFTTKSEKTTATFLSQSGVKVKAETSQDRNSEMKIKPDVTYRTKAPITSHDEKRNSIVSAQSQDYIVKEEKIKVSVEKNQDESKSKIVHIADINGNLNIRNDNIDLWECITDPPDVKRSLTGTPADDQQAARSDVKTEACPGEMSDTDDEDDEDDEKVEDISRLEEKVAQLVNSLEPLKNIAKGLIAVDKHFRHFLPLMKSVVKMNLPVLKTQKASSK